MQYLDIEEIILLHDELVINFWWLSWVKNKWQLESILDHIKNDSYYHDFTDKLIHLFFWIIQFHCFNDWNKRTAIASSDLFLKINGYEISDFVVKMEDIAIWVAKWEIEKIDLRKIFNSMFNSFGY